MKLNCEEILNIFRFINEKLVPGRYMIYRKFRKFVTYECDFLSVPQPIAAGVQYGRIFSSI